jgi:hypothetical protein
MTTSSFSLILDTEANPVVIDQPELVFGVNVTVAATVGKKVTDQTYVTTDWDSIVAGLESASSDSGYFEVSAVEFPRSDLAVTVKGEGIIQPAYIVYSKWDTDIAEWTTIFLIPKAQLDNSTTFDGSTSLSLDIEKGRDVQKVVNLTHSDESMLDLAVSFDHTVDDWLSLTAVSIGGEAHSPSTASTYVVKPGEYMALTFQIDSSSLAVGEFEKVFNLVVEDNDYQSCNYLSKSPLSFKVSVWEQSSKSSNSTIVTIIIVVVVVVVSCCLFAAAFAFWYYKKYIHKKSEEEQARKSRLTKLPSHRAIFENANTESILEVIDTSVGTIHERDYDGQTAFDLAISKECIDERIVLKLLLRSLPYDPETKQTIDPDQHTYAWTTIVQRDRFAGVINIVLCEYPTLAPLLSRAQDAEGRAAIDIASPNCKKTILRFLYFFKRYEIKTIDQPHHQSNTCIGKYVR